MEGTTIGRIALIVIVAAGAGAGCFESSTNESSNESKNTCSTLSGSSWSPSISGVGSSNHGTAIVSQQTQSFTGPVVGYADPDLAAKEITVPFTIGSDLGSFGSFTLLARASGLSVQGGALPFLVELKDPSGADYIRLARTGGSDCRGAGFYSSNGDANSSCVISNSTSAYVDRDHWEMHQWFYPVSEESINTFPTCNWEGGTAGSSSDPACAFNSTYFNSGKLPTGSYTAKYLLLSDSEPSLTGASGALHVSVIQKVKSSKGGAIDLNIVIVGNANVQSSRTAKGQQNLNLLFQAVHNYLSQANSLVKLGTITVYEWDCANGGDAYATVDAFDYTKSNYIGYLFSQGSSMVNPSSEGKALNVFLVSSIVSEDLQGTILGLSGRINGPTINGTAVSGLAFSTANELATFNPSCSLSSCPLSSQESDFVDMGGTIAHEIGHYLGLNHPSESDGATHDLLRDTPICTTKSGGRLTLSSCFTDPAIFPLTSQTCLAACPDRASQVFCPTQPECQFNHLMWYTTKDYVSGSGDGNLISDQAGTLINYSPFVQ